MDDLGFPLDSKYVENQQYFFDEEEPKNITVWVESVDDKRLWAPILNEIKSYNFAIKNAGILDAGDGKSADGCSRLIKLMRSGEITIGRYQIFCLDSDFGFISRFISDDWEAKKDDEYIYWTNIHSKENVSLTDGNIDGALMRILGITSNDLEQESKEIIESFSRSIHKPLTALILLVSKNPEQYADHIQSIRAPFNDAIASLHSIMIDKKINFEKNTRWIEFTEKAKESSAKAEEALQKSELKEDHDSFLRNISKAGISEELIYLFMRGHDLHSLFCCIFKRISESYKKRHHTRNPKNIRKQCGSENKELPREMD